MFPSANAGWAARRRELGMGISYSRKIWSGGKDWTSRGHEEAEDPEGISDGPTEPPSPTEPIPSPSDRTPDRTDAARHADQRVGDGRTGLGPNQVPSCKVSLVRLRCGNWRVIFRFVGKDVELDDYLDYH